MTNDRKQELERLEKELLADIADSDDLLADIPIELLDTTPLTWSEPLPVSQEDRPAAPAHSSPVQEPELWTEEDENMKRPVKKTAKASAAKKRDDKWVIGLMIVASFLCIGIIGVLIYWMEAFLK